jgi:hypothetical protein
MKTKKINIENLRAAYLLLTEFKFSEVDNEYGINRMNIKGLKSFLGQTKLLKEYIKFSEGLPFKKDEAVLFNGKTAIFLRVVYDCHTFEYSEGHVRLGDGKLEIVRLNELIKIGGVK